MLAARPFSAAQALLHAEAVLLVDDGQREVAEDHAFLEQRMRADDRPAPRRGDGLERAAARARRLRAGQQRHRDAERRNQASKLAPVLLGQQFGRRHQRGLPAAADRARRRSAATTVLPQPTSPCTRRIIGTSRARSCSTSSSTRRCAPVSANGSEAMNRGASCRGVGQRFRRLALHTLLQLLQRELVRQQFLEGQAALRGMPAGGERG
jgi:hypothetical protein